MGAITNKIKTDVATYLIKQSDWEAATTSAKGTLLAMRVSENGVEGTTETLESDVKLPGTRVKAAPELGSSSSTGTISTEFNISEQDELIASALCGAWVEDQTAETGSVTSYKTLQPGSSKIEWRMIKKYPQTPAEWRVYTGLQVNKLDISMALNSFVKLSFEMMGGNNPEGVSTDPVDSTKYTYGATQTTKPFKTLDGYIKLGSSMASLTALRQAPNLEISVNNNKESAAALFETEAIEMSDGDFEVTGTLDVWKADAIGMSLYNEALGGGDKCIEVQVARTVSGVKYSYTIQIDAVMGAPSEALDGNKYKVSIPFSVHKENGIKFIRKEETV